MSGPTGRLRARRLISALFVAGLVGGALSQAPAASDPVVGQLRASDNHRLGADESPLRGKDAPGLAVDPADPDHIVASHLDLNFFECGYSVTFDGGETWTSGVLTPPAEEGFSEFGACPVLGHGASSIDAGVMFGSGQNVYITWGTPRGEDGTSAVLSRSTDGGLTFEPAIIAIPGEVSDDPSDQEFPKLDVRPGAGIGGADQIVIATNSSQLSEIDHSTTGKVFVTVSNDSGQTWSPVVQASPVTSAENPYGAIEHTQPVFGPNGEIYVGWRTSPTLPSSDPNFVNGFLRVAKSIDGGHTWTYVDAINVQGHTFVPGPVPNPPFSALSRFCCSSFPRLAIDDNSGALYLVWSQDAELYESAGFQAQDHFMNQRSQVWFLKSTDGSQTWGGLRHVSESPESDLAQHDPANPETQTRHPNIAVASDGRVDVVWHDRRHAYRPCPHTHAACPEVRLGDTYYSHSLDAGDTFSANRRITDRHINNDVGFDYRFSTYWNFGPVSAPLGDTGKILFAWQDSREGNFDTDTMDIYLSTLDLHASEDVPVRDLGSGDGGSLSVALSQVANPGGSEARLFGTFSSQAATKVVIARKGDAAGVLAAGVLARANVGPLLLVPPSGLTEEVAAEVTRMSPIGAYIVGDIKDLHANVEGQLAEAGVPADQIVRLGGTIPAGTAAMIAMTLDRRSATQKSAAVPAFDAVIIANAHGPHAAAASNLAAARRLPVLYVDKGSIPQATLDALAALNINQTLVIGGSSVIRESVVSQLAAAGRNPTRLGGNDVYTTSIAVVQESVARGLPTNQVFVADGEERIHGSLLGAPSARLGGLLLLTPGGSTAQAEAMLDDLGLSAGLDRLITSNLE